MAPEPRGEVSAGPPPEEVEMEKTPPPPAAVEVAPPAPPEAQPGAIQRFKDGVMELLGKIGKVAAPWAELFGKVGMFALGLGPGPLALKLGLVGGALGLRTALEGRLPIPFLKREFIDKHPNLNKLLLSFANGAVGGGFWGIGTREIANFLSPEIVDNAYKTAKGIVDGGVKEVGGIISNVKDVSPEAAFAVEVDRVSKLLGLGPAERIAVMKGAHGLGKAVSGDIVKGAAEYGKFMATPGGTAVKVGLGFGAFGAMSKVLGWFGRKLGLVRVPEQPPPPGPEVPA